MRKRFGLSGGQVRKFLRENLRNSGVELLAARA